MIDLLLGPWWDAREEQPERVDHYLTRREKDVLSKVLAGMPVSKIARESGRCVTTISAQKRSMMRKLNVRNDIELTALSIQQGLL